MNHTCSHIEMMSQVHSLGRFGGRGHVLMGKHVSKHASVQFTNAHYEVRLEIWVESYRMMKITAKFSSMVIVRAI